MTKKIVNKTPPKKSVKTTAKASRADAGPDGAGPAIVPATVWLLKGYGGFWRAMVASQAGDNDEPPLQRRIHVI